MVICKQDPASHLPAGHAGQYGDFFVEIAVDEPMGITGDCQGVVGHCQPASHSNIGLQDVNRFRCLKNMMTLRR
jgi:hypothetical protein